MLIGVQTHGLSSPVTRIPCLRFIFRSGKYEGRVSGALARNMSVTGIELRHTSIRILNMRASYFKKHACLALDSISGPPNVRNTHVLPGIRSCSSSQDIHAPRFRTGASRPLPSRRVCAGSERRLQQTPDLGAVTSLLRVDLSTWLQVPRDQQRSLRGICRRFVPIREHSFIAVSCYTKSQ